MFLVDTDVISAGAPSKQANAPLLQWMDAQSAVLYLSVVTIAEIEAGIAKAERLRMKRKAADLSTWFKTLVHLYAERILPFDIAVTQVAGKLSDRARSRGHAPGFADIIIAATGHYHRLTILTRNLRHFQPLGVAAIDPFRELPDG